MKLSNVLGCIGLFAMGIGACAGGPDTRSSLVGGYADEGGMSRTPVTVPIVTIPVVPGSPVTVPVAGSTVPVATTAPAVPVGPLSIVVSNVALSNGSVVTADLAYPGLPAGASVRATASLNGHKGAGWTCAGAPADEHLVDLAREKDLDDPTHLRLVVGSYAATIGADWVAYAVVVNAAIMNSDGVQIGTASTACPADDPSLVVVL